MGWFKTESPTIRQIDPLKKQKKAAANSLTSLLNVTPEIPVQQTAGMTNTEQLGQKILGNFASTGIPAQYQQGLNALGNIVNSGSDITQLPEYKAILADSAAQTNDAVNQALRRIQISGLSGSTPQGRAVGRAVGEGQNRTVATLAPYAAQERQNRLNAINLLSSYINSGQQFDLNKLAAINNYGALPRELEQAKNNAAYQAMLTKIMFPYQQGADVASRIMGGNIDTAIMEAGPTYAEGAGQLMSGIGAMFKGIKGS